MHRAKVYAMTYCQMVRKFYLLTDKGKLVALSVEAD